MRCDEPVQQMIYRNQPFLLLTFASNALRSRFAECSINTSKVTSQRGTPEQMVEGLTGRQKGLNRRQQVDKKNKKKLS